MNQLTAGTSALTCATGPFRSGVSEIFWGEMAPCEHLVQIYQDDEVFMDALEGFACGGLQAGDGLIVIATEIHRSRLDQRLAWRGVDIAAAKAREQYISLDAEQTLARFIVPGPDGAGWPDEQLFEQLVDDLLGRARRGGRRVRAFGEMVAVLWARGCAGATVRLEHLWHGFCRKKAFCLFCAYPRAGFTQDATASMRDICEAHSKVLR